MIENEDLANRVEVLEAEVKEMWERMKQYEAVLSTAFLLRVLPTGTLKRK